MEAERVVNVINKFKNRRKFVCKWKKRIGFSARPIFTLRERTRVRERERKRARSKGRTKGLSTISEILSRGEEGSENLDPEYIFKCIFHATNFGAPSPPLVEICNSFEPPSCPVTRDGRSNRGTLSFIWNPLRVLMHSHYSAAFSWMQEEANKPNSIQASVWTKVTILIKEILPPPRFLFPTTLLRLHSAVTPLDFIYALLREPLVQVWLLRSARI